jgi:hypothetical protein
VRRTVPPSAEIEEQIDRLLAVGVGENPRESLFVRSGHEIGGPLDAGRRGKAGAAAPRLAIPLDSRLARLYCELKGAG